MWKQKSASSGCFSKLKVEDAHWFEKAKKRCHPAIGVQPRLRLIEETPFVEQVNAGAPVLDLFAAPEAPTHKTRK